MVVALTHKSFLLLNTIRCMKSKILVIAPTHKSGQLLNTIRCFEVKELSCGTDSQNRSAAEHKKVL